MSDILSNIQYLSIQFVPFSIHRMVTCGTLLEEAVDSAPPLPPYYADIFVPFRDEINTLRKVAARRILELIPEAREALDAVKNRTRATYGVVAARRYDEDEAAQGAATTLIADFFPEGLEVIVDDQFDVVGWALVQLDRMASEYAKEIRDARVESEIESLRTAVEHFVKVAGKHIPKDLPTEADSSAGQVLNRSRAALRELVLELGHCAKRHPDYLPVVLGILRPLDQITEQVREEMRRKAKKAKKSEEDAKKKAANEEKTKKSKKGVKNKAANEEKKKGQKAGEASAKASTKSDAA